MPGEGFAGRAGELAAIARCRAEAVTGTPWVVVIEGEAGIGKTALARQALEPGADGLRVCWAQADRSERDYPYGVLDQLLRRLPTGTLGARELAAALTPTASALTVGAGLLAVAAEACESAPLALALDDAPFADDDSLKALAFVLRRLCAEPILIVITARTGVPDTPEPSSDGAPYHEARLRPDWHSLTRGSAHVLSLHMAGLDLDEVGEVAAAAGADGLRSVALQRLHERTAGHPLHLRSLLAQVTSEALADLTHPLPVPATLDAITRDTLDHLPDDTRNLVEALAVLDATTPLATAAQLAGLTAPAHALTPPLDSRLVHWQPNQPTTPLRIHHQLQRDAVYHAITPARRRDLHAAAATLVGPDQAWAHRVAATDHTDPKLANELTTEADRQASQGRFSRAATLELWATNLVPTRGQYEHHLLTAATHLIVGGVRSRAQALRATVRECTPSPRRDAVLGYLISQAGGDFGTAVHLLTHAEAAATDPATRALAGTWLGITHILQAHGPEALSVLRLVVDQHPRPASVRGLLTVASSYVGGPASALRQIAAFGMPEHATQVPHPDSLLLGFRGSERVLAGQLTAGTDDLTTLAARQRADSNIPVISNNQLHLGFAHYLAGRWADTAISAERALLTADTQEQPWAIVSSHAILVLVHAQQGHQKQAQTHLDACQRSLDLFPEQNSPFLVLARAGMAQARADHAAMLDAIRAVNDPAAVVPGMRNVLLVLWVPLLVEAVTATENPASEDLRSAENALHEFDALANDAPALAATSHWLHARLADTQGHPDKALAEYRAGLATPAVPGDDIPLHRAFLHHDLAHHLQATSHPHDRAEAAHHLQQAHRSYTALGAAPYAQRAADQLARLHPAMAPPAADDPLTALTEREQQIAHLAAQGLTNQEIAHDLYLSPKTVEYHLGNTYTKLHLNSRRQLRTALQDDVGDPV